MLAGHTGAFGSHRQPSGLDYAHRGIANRSFDRRFALADHMQVRGANLKAGLLSLNLLREIPETRKPRASTSAERRTALLRRARFQIHRPAASEFQNLRKNVGCGPRPAGRGPYTLTHQNLVWRNSLADCATAAMGREQTPALN